MFCYNCGKEAELIDGLCAKCYSDTHKLLEFADKYDVTICSNCDRYQLGEWKDFKVIEDIVEEFVRKAAGKRRVSFTDEIAEPRDMALQVSIDVDMHDEYVTVDLLVSGFPDAYSTVQRDEEHAFILYPRYTTCPRCSKKYGGYYEATFQIRRDGRFLTADETDGYIAEVDEISQGELEKNKMAFITQVLKKKEGVNFQMGSLKFTKKLARVLQKKYGGAVSESYRLTGYDRQEGKARYRAAVVLRLPELEVGTFLLYDGRLWKISNCMGKITLVNFEESLSLDFKKVEKEDASGNLKKVSLESLRNGIIVFLDDGVAQIMPMEDYSTFEIERASVPQGAVQGNNVVIFSEEGRHYISSP